MPNPNHEIESLRAVVNNESLSAERREIAAKLLAQLEKPAPATLLEKLESTCEGIAERVAAERADTLAKFKVCSSCCLRQSKANETCDLCGSLGKWESPLPASLEQERRTAATTLWSDDELNAFIASTSVNTTLAAHCARVLELRGVPRVRGFWEGPSLDIHGHAIGEDAPKVRKALPVSSRLVTPNAGITYTGR